MRRAARVAALSDELTHLRIRGLDQLERRTPGRPPTATPQLTRLARRHARRRRSPRIPLIRRLLTDALADWSAEGATAEAPLVRGQIFDPEGRTPGPAGPGDLLSQVRLASGYKDKPDDFRAYNHTVTAAFASHLLQFVQREQLRRARPLAAALAGTLGLLVLLGGSGVLGSRQPTGAAPFRFDALGGGSSVIRVFPGVRDTPTDLIANGTFYGGQTAPAVCRTRGRLVTSDPSVAEQFRESDVWLQVLAQPGMRSFARLIYGRIDSAALAALPPCRNVP